MSAVKSKVVDESMPLIPNRLRSPFCFLRRSRAATNTVASTANKSGRFHNHEVFFRVTAHGFLVWALGAVLSASILASTAGSLASGVAKPVQPQLAP